ncbi:MAG TPA: acyl carrier protein [Actinomycetota bacterium]|nr:acyl carrier protein [Actinomycetota bacterium]
MTKGENVAKREEVLEAIKDHLGQRGIEAGQVSEQSHLVDDLGLDSLDTVELTLGLEERFGIEIPDTELEGVATVGDAVTLIEKKLSVGT